MAIFQISKIQVRRGKKNAGTGIPQLASGELGWAIDSQELYIGNGAVSEGAPKIGNTRLLTENDNIFNLVGSYTYKNNSIDNIQTGTSVNNPIQRSLQDRLDDTVNVRAFGAFGDGTDQTASLQRAINQLFLSDSASISESKRLTLYIPAGVYITSQPLLIPSYVTIIGDGKEKTIIRNTESNIFEFVSRSSDASTMDNITRPKFINIKKMSLYVENKSTVGMQILSCTDSVFSDLLFKGVYDNNPSETFDHRCIEFINNGNLSILSSSYNLFENIDFVGFNTAIYSQFNIENNIFNNCNFIDLFRGVQFIPAGDVDPRFNIFKNSTFDRILSVGIKLDAGVYNTSQNNKFLNVGNGNIVTPVIEFARNNNNSINDFFERSEQFQLSLDSSIYVKEIEGRGDFELSFPIQTQIGSRPGFEPLIKLPIVQGTIFVDYIYKNENLQIIRDGTIEITCNISNYVLKNEITNQNQLPTNPEISDAYRIASTGQIFVWNGNDWQEILSTLNDSYKFLGDIADVTSLKFKAVLDNNIDNTVFLEASNTSNVISDEFLYKIRLKS